MENGNNIRKLVSAYGTQKTLADRVGVERQTISRACRNGFASRKLSVKLAEVAQSIGLNMSVLDFIVCNQDCEG